MTCEALLLFDRDVTIGGFETVSDRLRGIGVSISLSDSVFVRGGLSVGVQLPEDAWDDFESMVFGMEGVSIHWDALAAVLVPNLGEDGE